MTRETLERLQENMVEGLLILLLISAYALVFLAIIVLAIEVLS